MSLVFLLGFGISYPHPPPTCSTPGMLNLVGRALEAEGISYVRLDGSTPAKARAERLRRFASREPGSPLVFLVRG